MLILFGNNKKRKRKRNLKKIMMNELKEESFEKKGTKIEKNRWA